jgi:chromosome segregation protein
MYLKNLTVFGFKSFADRTSLNFQRGITAIVGPNGCGKSNVADAVRWVLGEQSAKALRGGEMADVIFNGTDSRKQLGLAEVSLTIGDVDPDDLRAAGVGLDFNEVTITRRVFRDGGSEYFLNKTPCRLKDIQQLFAGTGMGKTSYSIMAQGNITQILSSKPEDRRLVFEEAAGITRFKVQKKEALRKLEQTEQNLLRVADLIREIKRQIGSLQRQAGKARRYKQIVAELQHLDCQLARHQYDVLLVEIRDREAAAEEARRGIEAASADVLRSEDEMLELRQRLGSIEHEISEGQQRATELRAQVEREEGRVQFHKERILEVEQQNARALAEIAQADERRLTAEQELAGLKERIAGARARIADLRGSHESRSAELAAIVQELEQAQAELRLAQSDAFAAAQDLSRVRNELATLELQKQAHAVRLEKLSAEKIQLEEERVRLEQRLAEFEASVEAEKAGVLATRGTVEERQARLREIQQRLQEAASELDALTQRQAETRSRLNILEQLDSSHEGFSSGALAALHREHGVLGSLADHIRVPDGRHILAVEAALGHHLQLVLSETPEAARTILAELAAAKKGRASIAPVAWQQNGSSHPESAGSPEGGSPPATEPATEATEDPSASMGNGHGISDTSAIPFGMLPLVNAIEAEPSVRPLLARLLDTTFLAPDLETATRARSAAGDADFVTEAGELLSRHGVFSGGAGDGNGSAASSILARKNQISELRQQVARIQDRVADASRSRGALQAEQTELQASLQEAQSELRAQEVAVATHQGEFNALQNSRRTLHQRIDTVIYEIESLATQECEANERRQASSLRLKEREQAEAAAGARVARLNADLEAGRVRRDQANAAFTEAKVAFAAEEQVLNGLIRQEEPLCQRLEELGSLLQQRRDECAACLDKKTQSEAQILAAGSAIDRLRHDRELLNDHIAELGSLRDAQAAALTERESALRELRSRLSALQDRRGDLEVELAQRRMSAENLVERIRQKYHVNLSEVRSECITITLADEGPPRVHVVTPEEMAASGAATDWEAVAAQVSALQKRVDEMGPVNLVAIEEYEEAEQRHSFLSTQHEDLIRAKDQLLEVIQRINRETRVLFAETFEKIRESFQALFVEIFDGGQADLQLADTTDVLESGIEIMARPPGKQLRSISLLSGGEQTMTAVALLFAIYQVKPSPFAVLDELDAPLDESNINRFIRVLQRFLERSQFIIITHNKRTIGMADILYGVTMQEQGVSKIVSVKFHKTDPKAAHNPPLTPAALVSDVEPEEEEERAREETIEVVMAK